MDQLYYTYTLNQLKRELRQRKAKTSGRKAELIERLHAYDRNFNFGSSTAVEVEEYIELPDLVLYKDINGASKLPPFTEIDADAYLKQFEQQFGKQGDNLYHAGFLEFVRSTVHSSKTYIRSQCRAEMKKSVSYNLDIVLNEYGNVEQCQCECPAGMGPTAHCKHIRACFHGLCDFTKKCYVVTTETCTQKLQKFHKSKKYTGSPLKASALTLNKKHLAAKQNILKTSSSVKIKPLHFDPRPPQWRKWTTLCNKQKIVPPNHLHSL